MSDPRSTSQTRAASRNRSKSPVPRPTTPLRTSSRSSFRNSQNNATTSNHNPLDALEPQFAELSDSMADLEANFMHLQLMHESLSRFGESFASFLYGLNMNAFVVDFPEQPLAESIKRWQKQQRQKQREAGMSVGDTSTILQSGTNAGDTTYMTSDTSFASMKATPRRRTMGGAPPTPKTASTTTSANTSTSTIKRSGIPGVSRGTTAGGRGSTRGGSRAGRASGLPRGRGGTSTRGVR